MAVTGYTEADLLVIQQAIIDFTAGNRVQSVTVGGRTTVYSGSTALAEMRSLRAEILAEIYAASGQTAGRMSVFSGGKGL